MSKTIKIILASAGIAAVVAAVVLGCIYFKQISERLLVIKNKLSEKYGPQDEEEFEEEIEIF